MLYLRMKRPMRVTRGSFSILTNGLSFGLGFLFQKIFLRYDEIVRNQQAGFFVGGACKLVETDVGSAVRYFFFQLVLVEGVELLQPFVRIGVHGTEL